jgi:hypothetical protein
MKFLLRFAGAGLFLISAPILRADSVLFTLSDSAHVFSFTLPTPATPDASGAHAPIPFFFFNDVPVTEDGLTTDESVLFLVEPVGTNQLEFADSFSVNGAGNITPTNEIYVFAAGEKFSGGSVDSPAFTPGTTVTGLTNDNLGTLRQGAVLSVTTPAAQTPEPGGFVLLGSGLLGFAGVIRRKLTSS